MTEYRIGDFEFVNATRQPGEHLPPTVILPRADLRQRPGVDGTDLREIGVKGEPFEYFTFVDCDNLLEAADRYRLYCEAILTGTPVDLIWADLNIHLIHKTKYHILSCEIIELRRLTAATGGLSTFKGAALRCRWELLPVQSE